MFLFWWNGILMRFNLEISSSIALALSSGSCPQVQRRGGPHKEVQHYFFQVPAQVDELSDHNQRTHYQIQHPRPRNFHTCTPVA